jgi:Kef-type K+ transport system membrane component KefB
MSRTGHIVEEEWTPFMSSLLHLFQEEPFGSLAILLAVTLMVPPIFERLRLPGVLGLLAAGVVLGPHSLALLTNTSPIMKLLADVGLIYLMFGAGLEIDLRQLNQVKRDLEDDIRRIRSLAIDLRQLNQVKHRALGLLILYTGVVLFGFDRAGRAFFQRTSGNEGINLCLCFLRWRPWVPS